MEFDAADFMAIASSKVTHLVRQALTLSLIATSENPWVGAFNLQSSGYLDGVV
jgi:hypothetical protein